MKGKSWSSRRRFFVLAVVGTAMMFSVFLMSEGAKALPPASPGADIQTETLTVPFNHGTAGEWTVRSYSGKVTVTVSGVGRASGPSWSDAFYIYTDYEGNPVTPYHPGGYYNYTLWINGGPAERSMTGGIPAYSANHAYSFELDVSADRHLHFAIGDSGTGDNSGSYRITVSSGGDDGGGDPGPTPGQRYDSSRASEAPIIDGDFSDWPATSGILMAGDSVDTVYGVTPSRMDSSALVQSMWDNNYLYFAIRVTDNRIISDSADIWQDDAFEIGLDGADDLASDGADDHQFTIAADGRTTDHGVPTTLIQASVRQRIDGWDVEVAIPATILGHSSFKGGVEMGLNFGLIDDDTYGRNDSHLIWEGDRTWAVDVTWGKIRLVNDVWPLPTPGPAPTATPPGDTTTLQDGFDRYEGTHDTKISEWKPDDHYGEATSISLRSNGVTSTLLQFDVDAIPENARIKKATLSLYGTDRSNPQGVTALLYLLRRPWSEAFATWREAQSGVPWDAPGAQGIGDRATAPFGSQFIGEIDDWSSFDVTDAVQAWVDDPEHNYGMIMVGEDGGSVEYYFYSRNTTASAELPYRPELIVTYWEAELEPTPTPTPTATPTPTPPPCQDAYEPDNSWDYARSVRVGDPSQEHNIHQPSDVDFVKFGVTVGDMITIHTSDLGGGMDSVLILYDTDGVTEITRNDDDPVNPPASRITWQALASGTYFIEAKNFRATEGSCDMTYRLAVEYANPTPTPTWLYLPMFIR